MGGTQDGRAVWGPGGTRAGRYAGRAGGTHQGLLSPSSLLLGGTGLRTAPVEQQEQQEQQTSLASWVPEAVPPLPLTLTIKYY